MSADAEDLGDLLRGDAECFEVGGEGADEGAGLDDLVGGKDWASAEDRGWYIPTLDGRGLTTGIVTAVTNYLDTGILPSDSDDECAGAV